MNMIYSEFTYIIYYIGLEAYLPTFTLYIGIRDMRIVKYKLYMFKCQSVMYLYLVNILSV